MAGEERPDQKVGPPKGPDKSFGHNGSQVEIYNLDQILSQSNSKIYDRSDFGGEIERVLIEKESLKYVEDNEPIMAITMTISLDPFRDKPTLYDPLDNALNIHATGFEVRDTVWDNTKIIVTPRGLRLMAWNNGQNNRVILSNNYDLHSLADPDNESLQVAVRPARLSSLEGDVQLEDFARTAVSLIDSIAVRRLKRTYRIGEKIQVTEKAAKDVGKAAMDQPESSTSEPDSNPKSGDELNDIFTRVEEKITLSDVGGLDDVKRSLQDIALSFAKPEIMEKWGAKRPQGILLYGPSGTGKTMLAQALANEIGADMLKVQSSDIYIKWLGDSEEKIKTLFTKFREIETPTVVLFDEVDAIIGITEQSSGADNARNSVAGVFKQEMNTLAADNPNILVVMTTNNLDRMDPSLVRSGRIDHKIYVPMPDDYGRNQIITSVMSGLLIGHETEEFKLFDDNIDVQKLVALTDGMSGADIAEIFRRISLSKAMKEARTGHATPISQSEIEEQIQDFKSESYA